MYKIILMILMATLLNANAGNYQVKFQGIKLGEIDSLDTLKSNYIQARVTNSIAKFFIKKKYFVFHMGEAPKIKDAKFRKDKNMVLFAVIESIREKPAHKDYKISDNKNMTIECVGQECKFLYYKKGHLDGKGIVRFDKDGEFVKLKEEISSVELSKI